MKGVELYVQVLRAVYVEGLKEVSVQLEIHGYHCSRNYDR